MTAADKLRQLDQERLWIATTWVPAEHGRHELRHALSALPALADVIREAERIANSAGEINMTGDLERALARLEAQLGKAE